MADYNYKNLNPKYDDTRYKINNGILRMMNANPTLGIGYLIGNALGENYFGKKRAKSSQEASDAQFKGVGADATNGVYGVDNKKSNDYYTSMNNALKEYQGNGGKVLYEGRTTATPNGIVVDTERGIYPRTPQQNNQSGITVGNVGNGGGVTSIADAWNNMNNGSAYNPGGTTMYTGAPRNLNNVMPSAANFPQKPANGPAPYTDDQLRQIAAQNFTPEELSRMATADERARMAALTAPQEQAAPAQSGGESGLLNAIANTAAQAASAPATEVPDPSIAYPMVGQGASGLTPAQIDTLNQMAAADARDEEPIAPVTNPVAQQSDLAARYKKNVGNMFGSAPSPASFSINLNSLIPQNSPYYSDEEKRLASARPFITRK